MSPKATRLARDQDANWNISKIDLSDNHRLAPGIYVIRDCVPEWNREHRGRRTAAPAEMT